MATIVGVHGIAQEFRGSHTISAEWLPSLKDGLKLAGTELKSDTDFRCAFYGDIFRGKSKAIGIPNYDVNDVDSDWEKELRLFRFLCGNEAYTDSFFGKIVVKVFLRQHFTIP
ncbi:MULTISPECIES: hypothetical protein [Microcystis]|uniref:Similarity n=2 Tax=Microcystis aeruginosa (strain PCC 7806) TaxID=267872 RepID=A8YKE8_MICA7|nr:MULTISPECIES: hypothetical protein [Microcystis]ARI80009.1 hypothetical protein BH695_0728 [Microcystis aeruginosa PCC 7806SL]UGS08378.1 hypothetical protein LRR78_19700 [Microcystis aeruginosa FACHB-905 = DIANCHI905]WKX63289.1 hypothetical protein Q3H53_003402 [Microcystis aeruginosa PCC 7806]CAO87846.1 unnamed protein product [Microcystis aeruginosa PCC 7806]